MRWWVSIFNFLNLIGSIDRNIFNGHDRSYPRNVHRTVLYPGRFFVAFFSFRFFWSIQYIRALYIPYHTTTHVTSNPLP